jgi:hypothetical protein
MDRTAAAASSPRLEIEFTRSYESFLDARVFLSCCPVHRSTDEPAQLAYANRLYQWWRRQKTHNHIDDLAQTSPALRGWWKHRYTMPDSVAWQVQGVGSWTADSHGSFSERVFDSRCDCQAGVVHNLTIEISASPLLQALPAVGKGGKELDWHFKLLSITTC